jgi:hypothetical protein
MQFKKKRSTGGKQDFRALLSFAPGWAQNIITHAVTADWYLTPVALTKIMLLSGIVSRRNGSLWQPELRRRRAAVCLRQFKGNPHRVNDENGRNKGSNNADGKCASIDWGSKPSAKLRWLWIAQIQHRRVFVSIWYVCAYSKPPFPSVPIFVRVLTGSRHFRA